MTAYTPDAWESFLVAQAGAAAALAGLLFVGVSINVHTVVASRRLVRRALEAFALLVEVLLVAAVALVPDASRAAIGSSLLVIALGSWAIVTRGHLQVVAEARGPNPSRSPRGSVPAQVVLGQAATISFIVGAVSLVAERGGGLYWLAPGVVVAVLSAMLNAWVLLIEIQR